MLVDVSFRGIEPGEHVALIGPSGAGKTTVADLLAGFYTPRSGTIRLDGQPLNRVSPASIHAAVRSVAADGTLFRASIRENIRYGRLDASDPDIDEVAEAAGLLPLLSRLREGLNTEIGEGGVALSAGERGGRIEQQGTPAELLRRPGYFHDMMRQPEIVIARHGCQRLTPSPELSPQLSL